VFAFLLDLVQNSTREVVPINSALRNRLQSRPGLCQRVNPMASLDRIKAAESVLVPTQYDIEVTAAAGIGDHLLKGRPPFCLVAADPLVAILANDPIAMFAGVLLHGHTLIRDRLILPIRAHAVVSYRWSSFRRRFG
jgi:hypothetical protein